MKKIILSLVSVTAIIVANAQTSNGDWMVGGNFRLNTANKNTQITFTPNAGYFFADNFAAGGNFSLNYNKFGNDKTTTFGIGPFARYYFTNPAQPVRPIIHGSFNYTSSKTKIGSNTSSTNTGFNYFLGGGAAAFISNNVSIDALLGYDHTKLKGIDGSGGFAMTIGFQVYINKKQMERMTGK